MKPNVWIGVLAFGLCVSASADPQISLSRKQIPNGGLASIEVTGLDTGASVTGEADGTPLLFFFEKPGQARAFFGVPYHHDPATAQAAMVRVKTGSSSQEFKLSYDIVSGNYPSEVLKVSPRHVNPSEKDMVRIEREKKEVGEIYGRFDASPLWKDPFLHPLDSDITSDFGTKRVFNGELQSFHNGIDFRAQVGVPIRAANSGVVVLAKHLFFTGNTVILSHGNGIMTLYAHMSKLKVKKGQRVGRKQLLGLAGKTGRVSGPHLHFSAIVQKVRVNPKDLLELLGPRASLTQP